MVLLMTIYTDQKFSRNSRKTMFFYTDQKTRNSWKGYTDCERAKMCGIFGSETYDSPQYSVDKSHGLSVQKIMSLCS